MSNSHVRPCELEKEPLFIPHRTLMNWSKQLREKGIFFKGRNEPKQAYIERGYFKLKDHYIERSEHDGFTVIKVLVTQKGLSFLSTLFDIGLNKHKKASLV